MQQYGGPAIIVEKIGVEPTGLPFDSRLALELYPARSVDPLVNAGTLAAVRSGAAGDLTAGFYDESGAWAYGAGLPAKTGVGGGIVAVAPGKLAIAAFSPRLNEAGNSVRSLRAIRSIAGELGLDIFGANPE